MTTHVQDLIAVRRTRRTAKLTWTGLAIAALAVLVFVVVLVSTGSSDHAQPTAPTKTGGNHAGNVTAFDCLPSRVVHPC